MMDAGRRGPERLVRSPPAEELACASLFAGLGVYSKQGGDGLSLLRAPRDGRSVGLQERFILAGPGASGSVWMLNCCMREPYGGRFNMKIPRPNQWHGSIGSIYPL